MASSQNDNIAQKIVVQAAKDYKAGKRMPPTKIPAELTHSKTDPSLAKSQGMYDYIVYRLNKAGIDISRAVREQVNTVAATSYPITSKSAYADEKTYVSQVIKDVIDPYESLRQARVDNYEVKNNLGITDKFTASAKASVLDYLTPGGMASTTATAAGVVRTAVGMTAKKAATGLPTTMPVVAKGAAAVSKAATARIATVASLLGLDALAIACTPATEQQKDTAVIPDSLKAKFAINGRYGETSKETLAKALKYCNEKIKEESKALTYTDKHGYKKELTGPAAEAHKTRLMQYKTYSLELRNALVPPTWMLKQYFKFDKNGNIDLSKVDINHLKTVQNHAHKMAVSYRHIINKGVDIYVDGKGNKHHIDEAQTQLAQYKRLEELCIAAQKQLKTNAQASAAQAKAEQQSLQQQNVGQNIYSGNGYAAAAANSEAPQQTDAAMQSSAGTATTNGITQTGWEKALFGDLNQANIGSTLASLPDAMISMLTGSSNTMGMNKSTIMPFVALFGAYFFNNPLLKLLCGITGMTGLMKNVAKENKVLEDQKTNSTKYSTATNYRQYADEQLNTRLSVKGINGQTIVMDIDNVPHTIIIPTQAAEAYQQGKLPLNTLANAVLKKYDEQTQQAQQTFDQGRQQQEEQGRTIHR